jgi:AcrR family transcriptional regulator
MRDVADPPARHSRPYRGATLETRRKDQRERIIAAATTVFARDGYAAAGIDDVVARARVSRSSFYELFANKEACLLAVFERGMETMAMALAEVAAQPLRPRERIRSEVHTVAATFAANPDMARIVLIESVGAAPRVEQARVHARLAMAQLIETQLAGYPEWADRTEPERRFMSMSAMAAVVEPLGHLVATGRLDDWEEAVEPVTEFIARGLIRG